jgi:hypothetical protein
VVGVPSSAAEPAVIVVIVVIVVVITHVIILMHVTPRLRGGVCLAVSLGSLCSHVRALDDDPDRPVTGTSTKEHGEQWNNRSFPLHRLWFCQLILFV